jgi:NAD(P)H-dependent flavin oxidoreductase YrpB (nitropropane dioxygenase family)
MRALRNTERVLKNKAVDELLEIERQKGASLKIQDIHDQVAGVYPKVMIDGDMDAGAWSCGMVVGLINDIPTVKELIDRIMTGAKAIIRQRLTGVLDGIEVKAPARAVARATRTAREDNMHTAARQ